MIPNITTTDYILVTFVVLPSVTVREKETTKGESVLTSSVYCLTSSVYCLFQVKQSSFITVMSINEEPLSLFYYYYAISLSYNIFLSVLNEYCINLQLFFQIMLGMKVIFILNVFKRFRALIIIFYTNVRICRQTNFKFLC